MKLFKVKYKSQGKTTNRYIVAESIEDVENDLPKRSIQNIKVVDSNVTIIENL